MASKEKFPDPIFKNQEKVSKGANLPAGLPRKASDLHAVGGTAGARMGTLRRACEFIALTGAACELDGQSGPIEIRSIFEPT